MGDEQSQSIKTSKTAIEASQLGVEAAKAQRLPDIGASLSIGYLGDGVLGDRDLTGWQYIDNPHFMNNFALKAQLVIYAGGAIESGVSLAELAHKMAELDYTKNRQEIRFIITSHYLDLCRLQKKSVELADQCYSVTEKRYENGLALLTDMLDASNSKLSADLGLVDVARHKHRDTLPAPLLPRLCIYHA